MSADLWKILTCTVTWHYSIVFDLSFSQASQPDELTIDEHEMLEVIEDGDMEDWVKVNQSNLCLFQQFNTTRWSSFQDCNSIRSTEENDFCVSCNVKNKIYTEFQLFKRTFWMTVGWILWKTLELSAEFWVSADSIWACLWVLIIFC